MGPATFCLNGDRCPGPTSCPYLALGLPADGRVFGLPPTGLGFGVGLLPVCFGLGLVAIVVGFGFGSGFPAAAPEPCPGVRLGWAPALLGPMRSAFNMFWITVPAWERSSPVLWANCCGRPVACRSCGPIGLPLSSAPARSARPAG